MRAMDLKLWLRDQGLSVREFALELEVPLKTAQDWVYRGVDPSVENRNRLVGYISSRCTHHWVIDAANGHTSRGVCKRCDEVGEFENSTYATVWIPPKRASGQRLPLP